MIKKKCVMFAFLSLYSCLVFAETDRQLFDRLIGSGTNYFKKSQTQSLPKEYHQINNVYRLEMNEIINYLKINLACSETYCSSAQVALPKLRTLLDIDAAKKYISINVAVNEFSRLVLPAAHLNKAFALTGNNRDKVFYDYFKSDEVWDDIFTSYKPLLSKYKSNKLLESQIIKFAVLCDELDSLYMWFKARGIK